MKAQKRSHIYDIGGGLQFSCDHAPLFLLLQYSLWISILALPKYPTVDNKLYRQLGKVLSSRASSSRLYF